MKPSGSGNIPHLPWVDAFSTASCWPLRLKDFLRMEKNERLREWDGKGERESEREKGNEGWCNSLSGWRKELGEKITQLGRWDEARIPKFHLIHKWFQLWPTKAAESSSYLAASTKSYWQNQTGVHFPAEENLLVTEEDKIFWERQTITVYKTKWVMLGVMQFALIIRECFKSSKSTQRLF